MNCGVLQSPKLPSPLRMPNLLGKVTQISFTRRRRCPLLPWVNPYVPLAGGAVNCIPWPGPVASSVVLSNIFEEPALRDVARYMLCRVHRLTAAFWAISDGPAGFRSTSLAGLQSTVGLTTSFRGPPLRICFTMTITATTITNSAGASISIIPIPSSHWVELYRSLTSSEGGAAVEGGSDSEHRQEGGRHRVPPREATVDLQRCRHRNRHVLPHQSENSLGPERPADRYNLQQRHSKL